MQQSKLGLVLGILAFRSLYDWCYYLIYPSHEYHGIAYDPSFLNILISIVSLILLPFLLNLRHRQDPSKIFIYIYIFLFLIPLSSYFSLGNQSLIFFLWCYFAIVLLGLITIKPIYLTGQSKAILVLVRVLPIVVIVSSFILVFYSNGLPSLGAFNFLNVYSIRSNFNSNTLIEYFSSSAIYFAFPVMLSLLISSRRYFLSILIAALWLFLFLSSGGRITLIFLALTIFLSLAVRFIRIEKAIPVALGIIILMSIIEIQILKTSIFAHFGFYRSLIVPSWLSYEYFDFYQFREKLLFIEQFPSLLNTSFTDINSALDVGSHIFGDESNTWANVGIAGYSFANLSYFGFLELLIFAPILKILDGCYSNKNFSKHEKLSLAVYVSIVSMYSHSTNIYNLLASRSLLLGLLFFIIFSIYRSRSIIHEK